MKDFQERHGVRIFQAWGMTETSPVATFSRPRRTRGHDERYWDERALQGKPLPWVELRLIGDDGGEVAVGRASPRARSRCAGRGSPPATTTTTRATTSSTSGWLRTGDIAAIDEHALRADHRPRQGRDQVRRRVDLLGRAGERADGPPRRARGGGDRQARRALGRAPAVLRGAARGRRPPARTS